MDMFADIIAPADHLRIQTPAYPGLGDCGRDAIG